MNRRIVHRDHWHNLLVEIIDTGDERSLFFGGDVLQSSMSLSVPYRLVLSYTRYMMAALLINESPVRVLVIGVGAGSLVRFLYHHLPTCRIDGIDNASPIIQLARGFFQLPVNDRLTIHCRDGYDYLRDQQTPRAYDLILLDAFDGAGMAASVYRHQCFELCRRHLQPGGVLSVNLWSGDTARMAAVRHDIADCFGAMLTMPVPNRGNVVCLAGRQDDIGRVVTMNRHDLNRLSDRFGIDFRLIVGLCRKNNLTRWQRLSRFFS